MSALDGNMPHASFLQDIQNWVWKRFPTRQLSASDIFYVMQWAETGVPSIFFIDGFEAWLRAHPKEFITNANLANLRFEADRIIEGYRSLHPVQLPVEINVEDPFETMRHRLEILGKSTQDEALRKDLRKIYQQIRTAQRETQSQYPDWNQRAESFYTLKARALIVWDECIESLITQCFSRLPQEKQEEMKVLTPAENLHLLRLGDEAQEMYKKTQFHQRIAKHYEMESLLDPI
ncbi:MAG: hypothetical protein J6A01_04610 [Proteobacteria bacterium]|nr:hypothetical protein [Pseudomonadota bacterium]